MEAIDVQLTAFTVSTRDLEACLQAPVWGGTLKYRELKHRHFR